jgi:hypothetical protein
MRDVSDWYPSPDKAAVHPIEPTLNTRPPGGPPNRTMSERTAGLASPPLHGARTPRAPIWPNRDLVTPKISYAYRKAGRVVHADDERIEPSVSVLYEAGLAVDDYVLVIAQHHTHFHAARGQQGMQTAIAVNGAAIFLKKWRRKIPQSGGLWRSAVDVIGASVLGRPAATLQGRRDGIGGGIGLEAAGLGQEIGMLA